MGKTILCIPAYNNEMTIPFTIFLSEEYIENIFVIDDASTDETENMVTMTDAHMISNYVHMGRSSVIGTCISLARKEKNVDRLVMINPDGKDDPDQIPLLLSKMDDEECDLVIGSRYLDGKKKPKGYGSDIKEIIGAMNLFQNNELSDPASLFRVYSKKAISFIYNNQTFHHDKSIEKSMIQNFKIREVSITDR